MSPVTKTKRRVHLYPPKCQDRQKNWHEETKTLKFRVYTASLMFFQPIESFSNFIMPQDHIEKQLPTSSPWRSEKMVMTDLEDLFKY